MDSRRRREYQRAHCLHWILHDNPRMALLNLVLTVAVHANDTIVDRTLSLRDYRRLLHDIEILLFYHRRRWNHRLQNVLDHRRLLLNRGEKALLLLLLGLRIRYMMSHLRESLLINATRLKLN